MYLRSNIVFGVFLVTIFLILIFLVATGNNIDNKYGIGSFSVRKPQSFKMLIVGDVLLARAVERMELSTTSVTLAAFSKVSRVIEEHDYVVANFEAAIPQRHISTPDLNTVFSVREDLATKTASHVTHWSLANNHSGDFGPAGLDNTITVLNEVAKTFGHDREVTTYLQHEGIQMALVGLNAVGTSSDHHELAVLRAAARSDIQIVYIHWGEEYATSSNEWQRSHAQLLIDSGADLIVGHHPHVMQEIEYIDGVPVVYSLGNFIFDQFFSPEVQVGMGLSITFTSDDMQIEPVFFDSRDSRSVPQLTTAEQLGSLLPRGYELLQ